MIDPDIKDRYFLVQNNNKLQIKNILFSGVTTGWQVGKFPSGLLYFIFDRSQLRWVCYEPPEVSIVTPLILQKYHIKYIITNSLSQV